MKGNNIGGNGSKATLPGGKKLSDKVQENKTKQASENKGVGSAKGTSKPNNSDNQGNPISKMQQAEQNLGTEAMKKAAKTALDALPYTKWIPKGIRDKIVDKYLDSPIGQYVVKRQIKDIKIKITMVIVVMVASFVMTLLMYAVIISAILAPVAWIGDLIAGVANFFKSVGNWFIGNGWCTDLATCQTNAEYKYYEKLDAAVAKYKGSCEINEDLITATIFYGQMVSEEPLNLLADGDEGEYGGQAQFNYIDVSEKDLKQPAKDQINKLIKVYLKGEDLSDDEKEELAEKEFLDYDQDDCAFSVAKYKDYLIEKYIDWAYPSVVDDSRTKEVIADEILAMGNVYMGTGQLTIIGSTDGLFTMLPSGLNLKMTSQPANCRCHPTKHFYESHKGVDIGGASYGTSILAFDDGIIDNILIATTKTCGSSIIRLKHTTDSGEVYYTRYVHLNRNSNNLLSALKVGDNVSKGQVIGYVGGTTMEDSCSTGPHLHFEVHNSEGKVINPVLALNNHKNGISVLENQEIINQCTNKGASC